MTAAGTVAYAICRHCASVFPAQRRCPRCHEDAEAAAAIATATAHAVEPVAQVRAKAAQQLRPPRMVMPLVGVAALMLGLGVGLAWLVVHEATPTEVATTQVETGEPGR